MQKLSLANISLDDILAMISSEVDGYLERYEMINVLIPSILFVLAIYYLIRSVYGYKKRNFQNVFFQIYCIFLIVLSGVTALTDYYGTDGAFAYPVVLGYAMFLSLPALFCLHIWTQVSYKKIRASMLVLYFFVPFLLTALTLYNTITGTSVAPIWTFLDLRNVSISLLLLLVYWVFMLVKSFLLCFNVLYQMPKHMRAATILLLAALSASAADLILSVVWTTKFEFYIFLLVQYFILNRCFRGFFRSKASNVIATSREFVFSNLSTQILVLSMKRRILDWNNTGVGGIFSFHRPKYLQPYGEYLEELLAKGNGVISPHQDNIISVTFDDVEYHLLITTTPIKEDARQFGTLIEISEVTNLYTVLRYMETIATIDQMTGLYNKNAYLTKAHKMMTPALMPLLIVLGDVNDLKQANDLHGHLTGDRMLGNVAKTIAAHKPPGAFVARIGGDEIVLLVPNATEADAEQFVGIVNASLQEIHDEEYGTPSISWGWAVAKSPEDEYNDIFKQADSQMYARKRAYKAGQPITLSGTLPNAAPKQGAQPGQEDTQSKLEDAQSKQDGQ
ncbi:MAG: GGDEF domain-containing protein [Clostridiales Family XIII bacterium]|jgi:diguanylate cyclase (GGDEF)-like protein|nr:GGDEF domain-containing protein [Clostridiales Family XIII bacterium]